MKMVGTFNSQFIETYVIPSTRGKNGGHAGLGGKGGNGGISGNVVFSEQVNVINVIKENGPDGKNG
jgi:hypothetical protein